MQGAGVPSLAEELRSHMARSTVNKREQAKRQGGQNSSSETCQPGHMGTAPGPAVNRSVTQNQPQLAIWHKALPSASPHPLLRTLKCQLSEPPGQETQELTWEDRRQGNVTTMTHKHISPPSHSHQDQVPPLLALSGTHMLSRDTLPSPQRQ